MAIGVVARRLVPRSSSSSSSLPSHRITISTVKTRSFASASAAARVQDEDVVQVSKKESHGNNSTATSSASANAAAVQSARPTRGFLPGLRFPFGQATSLMDMMDSMDRIFGSVFPSSVSPLLRAGATNRLPWDVTEDDKCFKLRVDLPGYGKDDVKLGIDNGDLTLTAEHSTEESEEDWSSRSYGAFNARISLPDNVDQGAIKAILKNGVLDVMVPKTKTHQNKLEIQID